MTCSFPPAPRHGRRRREPRVIWSWRATIGCAPTASNGYKVTLLAATVLEALERAAAAPPAGA